MAESSKIRVMISSRCNDTFPVASKKGVRLGDLRLHLKREVEGTSVLGELPYEVWIHEKATENALRDSWDECLKQARECDIFIALYNGNAGWTEARSGTVGICQQEFNTAYAQAPGKVFIINMFEPSSPKAPARPVDKEFQKLMDTQRHLGRVISDSGILGSEIKQMIVQATVKMVHLGVREANRGRGYLGPALVWNRQNYSQRQASMIAAMRDALDPRGAPEPADARIVDLAGAPILFRLSAIPDSISVASAREIVGQPHLADHAFVKQLAKSIGGPVHIVGCHKGVTAAQAQRMLGFPNATIVNAPFGIYVVDPVQAIQLVLISKCSDATETKHGVQRFIAWLEQADQSGAMVSFAKKRKEVARLLAQDT
jgi:hypothetical protein